MDEPKRPPQRPPRAPRKTPAERSEEFDETQRRLKEEAAGRRDKARQAEADRKG